MMGRTLRMLEVQPPRWLKGFHQRSVHVMRPYSQRFLDTSDDLAVRYVPLYMRRSYSNVTQKGVVGLIAANVTAYLILNSHFMKSRSRADGLPRVDRHFIASKYNLSEGRFWCIPLSLFNHGDSLMHLIFNCVGIALVGPAVELAFGAAGLVSAFIFSGTIGASAEMLLGNNWCRGSSAGVMGLFAVGAFSSPMSILSIWGVWDVRASSLAITLFGIESLLGIFGSKRSDMAHVAHAAGLASAIPILYYMRWFRRPF